MTPNPKPEPSDQDRANWALGAYQLAYRHPDSENPYKRHSRSWLAWREGREDRLTGRPMYDPPRYRTALRDWFQRNSES